MFPWSLEANAPGYATEIVTVPLEDADIEDIELRLERSSGLALTVATLTCALAGMKLVEGIAGRAGHRRRRIPAWYRQVQSGGIGRPQCLGAGSIRTKRVSIRRDTKVPRERLEPSRPMGHGDRGERGYPVRSSAEPFR